MEAESVKNTVGAHLDVIRQIQVVQTPSKLNEWERDFLHSLFLDLRAGFSITERQFEILTKLWVEYVAPFSSRKQKSRKCRRHGKRNRAASAKPTASRRAWESRVRALWGTK